MMHICKDISIYWYCEFGAGINKNSASTCFFSNTSWSLKPDIIIFSWILVQFLSCLCESHKKKNLNQLNFDIWKEEKTFKIEFLRLAFGEFLNKQREVCNCMWCLILWIIQVHTHTHTRSCLRSPDIQGFKQIYYETLESTVRRCFCWL